MGSRERKGEDSNKGTCVEKGAHRSSFFGCFYTRKNERYPEGGILAKRIPISGKAFTVSRSGWVGGVRPEEERRGGRGPTRTSLDGGRGPQIVSLLLKSILIVDFIPVG